jgi:hypothetical protein
MTREGDQIQVIGREDRWSVRQWEGYFIGQIRKLTRGTSGGDVRLISLWYQHFPARENEYVHTFEAK